MKRAARRIRLRLRRTGDAVGMGDDIRWFLPLLGAFVERSCLPRPAKPGRELG
jgi:hypothetical protein